MSLVFFSIVEMAEHPAKKRKILCRLLCPDCTDQLRTCDSVEDLTEHLRMGHNLSTVNARAKAEASAKAIKKGILTLSEPNIAVVC